MVKGFIEKIIKTDYLFKVRIPTYHRIQNTPGATPTEDLPDAPVCTTPGVNPHYQVGDVVWCEFENDELGSPVIVGLLYREEGSESTSDIQADSIKANVNADLPTETRIGDVVQSIQSLPQLQDQLLALEDNVSTNVYQPLNGILDSCDLNTVTDEGFYSLIDSNTYQNLYGNIAGIGVLEVRKARREASYVEQLLCSYNPSVDDSPVIGQRYTNDGGTTWTQWETQVSARFTLKSGTDLDDVVTPGYYVLSGTNTYSNLPSGITYGILSVICGYKNANFIKQILYSTQVSNNSSYERLRTNSVWSGWSQTINSLGGVFTNTVFHQSTANDASILRVRNNAELSDDLTNNRNRYVTYTSSDDKNLGLSGHFLTTTKESRFGIRAYTANTNAAGGFSEIYVSQTSSGVGNPIFRQGADANLSIPSYSATMLHTKNYSNYALPLSGGTLTGKVWCNFNANNIKVIEHNFKKGTNPSSSNNRNIVWTDNTAQEGEAGNLGYLSHVVSSDGNSQVALYAIPNSTNSGAYKLTGLRAETTYNSSTNSVYGRVYAYRAGVSYVNIDSGNYNDYALPLTGGIVRGQVNLTSNESAPLRIRHSFARGTNPTGDAEYRNIYFNDNGDTANYLAAIQSWIDTSGDSYLQISAHQNSTSSNKFAALRVAVSKLTGTEYFKVIKSGTSYDIYHEGNLPMEQLYPTWKNVSDVTIQQSNFYRVGKIVFVQAVFTLTATVQTQQPFWTGLPGSPSANGTIYIPCINRGATGSTSVLFYLGTGGNLANSGSMSAGSWLINGWYQCA